MILSTILIIFSLIYPSEKGTPQLYKFFLKLISPGPTVNATVENSYGNISNKYCVLCNAANSMYTLKREDLSPLFYGNVTSYKLPHRRTPEHELAFRLHRYIILSAEDFAVVRNEYPLPHNWTVLWDKPGSTLNTLVSTGLILGLHRANERRCYFVTTSLIGWVQAEDFAVVRNEYPLPHNWTVLWDKPGSTLDTLVSIQGWY